MGSTHISEKIMNESYRRLVESTKQEIKEGKPYYVSFLLIFLDEDEIAELISLAKLSSIVSRN